MKLDVGDTGIAVVCTLVQSCKIIKYQEFQLQPRAPAFLTVRQALQVKWRIHAPTFLMVVTGNR